MTEEVELKQGRVTLIVTPERQRRINTLIRYGLRRALINAVIDLVLDAIERDGEIVVGYVLDGRYSLVPKK